MPRLRDLCRWWPAAAIAAGCVGLACWGVDARVASLLRNTALLVIAVELLALPLGALLAMALVKTDVPGRRAAWMLVVAMLFVPLYMFTGAWDAGFGIQGWHTLTTNPHLAVEPWLSGWRGAIWVHAMAAVPWVTVIVAAGLRSVESDLEEDALLETGPLSVLMRVTLRRAAGAVVVAAVWVAILVSAEMSVTDVYQVRTFAEEVYTQAVLGSFDFAATTETTPDVNMGVRGLWIGIALAASLVVLALAAGQKFFHDLVHVPERRTWNWQLRAGRWPVAAMTWLVLLVVAFVPLLNLIYKAGVVVTATETGRERSWSIGKVVEQIAAAPREYQKELWHSATLGVAAATAALFIAVALAWQMRRQRGAPWVQLAMLAFLMAIPGPLLGIGLIRLLNQPIDSPLSGLAWLYDTDFAPWLVQTLRALPAATLILWVAFSTVPQTVLDAATTDRAGWFGRLIWIVLPLRWPAVVAAWLVGFAVAIGELAATVLVVPPGPTTISVQIFSLIHYGVDDRVASISLVMAAGLALVVMLAVRLLPQNNDAV